MPLPQDTAKFDANSFDAPGATVVQDMPRIGSVNWTGATNSPTWTTSTAASVFGSLNLTNLGTLTASTQAYTQEGRGANTITTAGKSWAKAWTVNAPGGSLTLSDAFTSTAALTATAGTLADGGQTITAASFTAGASATCTFSGLRVITGSGAAYTAAGTYTDTGTVKLTDSTGAVTAALGGNTVGALWYSPGAGTGGLVITGTNTITGAFTLDGSGAYTVTLPNDTTTLASMTRSTTTNVITLARTGGSGTATISDSSAGLNILPYMSISNVAVTPTNTTWYAPLSTDGGGNTGWVFGWPLRSPLQGIRPIRPIGG